MNGIIDRTVEDRLWLTVTDLKQYAYCPRILFLTYNMPVPRPLTPKMEFGKDGHYELDRLERRRKLVRYGLDEGERVFHTSLTSHKLGVEGKLDLHIETERECAPVEFKHSNDVHFNHKVQLGCYGMMLEETTGKPVRWGFIYLIPHNDVVPVQMTSELREYVHRTVDAIRIGITKGVWPRPTTFRHRCRECEYRRYCRDVG